MTWEDQDDTSATRVRRNRFPFLPILLIAIGAGAVIDQTIGNDVGIWEVFWLAVGMWCVSRSRDGGPYPLLVIGAFLVGNNAGELLGALVGRGVADATETLGTAAGFMWLYGTDRPRSGWAIWPAGVIGIIGVAELGGEVTELVDGGGGWLVPAGVIVAGVMLLGAHRMPGPLRLAGLVFLGAAALSLLANAGDRERDERNVGRRGFVQPPTTNAPQTFEIGERTVHIRGNNGSVTVNEGPPTVINGQVTATDDDELTIEPRAANSSIVVSVPRGTRLDIALDNASVFVNSPTANADIATDNGQIVLHVLGNPSIDAETNNGQILVDTTPQGDDYEHEGEAGDVELDTDNGQIVVIRDTEPVGAGQR